METALEGIWQGLVGLWSYLETQFWLLTLPSRLWQIGILVGCFAVSVLLAVIGRRRLRNWAHTREGWPRWRLRLLVIFERRLQLMLFVLLSWAATLAMQQTTIWTSRSYILELVATIASVWLAITFAARIIRNRALRRVVVWSLGIWMTLYFLGLTGEVSRLLDRAALEFGEFRLSALTLIEALVVVGLLFALARFVIQVAADRIHRNEGISPTMQVLSVQLLQLAFYSIAILVGLRVVGVDLTAFAFMSGAIGLGLGFGLQKVVSNLVSGLILLFDKSIKPGDVISLGDTFGWITELRARYVGVVTRDGKEYLIPNEDLITGQVVNWSHSNRFVRLDIYFGTSYGDDPHLVRRVAVEAAKGVDRVLTHRAPVCHIVEFGDSSVNYILRFWIDDPTGGLTNIRGNVFLALWDAFKENGIQIPFPQREVRVLDGSRLETLRADSLRGEAAE
ncbi:mechanosensitive ion channel family protein [Roseitranquillus sediminis]|uniref:mechanosensitive ion channel family protein n=1 Tax=Roseitranquillus sediminis TaxID=2809051 RepID=UPI001D0C3D1F|nr:mechanosensitive ion channel domain-containing protein [Roseitranquillus sediminis]MBM9596209.1 mechanosensitive ion channel [Roseitranquillus sediminis]